MFINLIFLGHIPSKKRSFEHIKVNAKGGQNTISNALTTKIKPNSHREAIDFNIVLKDHP